MCCSNPDSRGRRRVNNRQKKTRLPPSPSVCVPSPRHPSLSFFEIFHFRRSIVFIQMVQFLPPLSPRACDPPSAFFLWASRESVTTERLYVKEVAQPSFAQLFGDLCCQFVSVSLWESCLCVCLSPARCAGYQSAQRLKPLIPFPIISMAFIIVCFELVIFALLFFFFSFLKFEYESAAAVVLSQFRGLRLCGPIYSDGWWCLNVCSDSDQKPEPDLWTTASVKWRVGKTLSELSSASFSSYLCHSLNIDWHDFNSSLFPL